MKRLFRIFELTKNEQRVVLIVMLILITITLVTYERRVDHHPTQVTSTIGVEPSPKLVSSVGPPISGASQKAKPMSATVSVVASEFDNFMLQTGNLRVTFSDRHSEVWNSEGNCASPRVSSKGDVGWISVDKSKVDLVAKNRQGEDKVIIQLFDGQRKALLANPSAPFVGNWGFSDGDTAVAIQSSGYHGSRFSIKYDLSTGKVVDEIDGYLAFDKLPSWAKQISDERQRGDE